MNILFDMGHPAHVHFFRHAIGKLEEQGHSVKVTARDKDVTLELLDAYGIAHEVRGRLKGGLLSKAADMFRVDLRLLEIAKDFKPDITLGVHNPYTAQISWILNIPSITFTDSEPVPIADYLTFPFTSIIITPTTFRKAIGKKHKTVNSYKELAYLHPNEFTPDPDTLRRVGIDPGERYIVMRFVSWEASHDVAVGGLSNADKINLANELKGKARLIISSERELPGELEPYRMNIPAQYFHDLLAFSSLLVTDSQTVTTEAACLGVPVVRCNSFVGEGDMGNFIELEEKYGLIYSLRDPEKAMVKATELAGKADLRSEWKEKRDRMLADKIDMTEYLVWLITNWPDSLDGEFGR